MSLIKKYRTGFTIFITISPRCSTAYKIIRTHVLVHAMFYFFKSYSFWSLHV